MARLNEVLDGKLAEGAAARVKMGMDGLKERAKNLIELSENAVFYAISRPLQPDEKASQILTDEAKQTLTAFRADVADIDEWTEENVQAAAKAYADAHEMKLGKVAQPLRAALTGTTVSPGIFEVMAVSAVKRPSPGWMTCNDTHRRQQNALKQRARLRTGSPAACNRGET